MCNDKKPDVRASDRFESHFAKFSYSLYALYATSTLYISPVSATDGAVRRKAIS